LSNNKINAHAEFYAARTVFQLMTLRSVTERERMKQTRNAGSEKY